VLDHVSLRVANYERSKQFYIAALAPLGFTLAMESASSGAGFRRDGIPVFWIKQGEPGSRGDTAATEPGSCGGPAVHVAFASPDRAAVNAFHQAALAAGARDNGGPGVWPQYHANYYGAFVLDPDGYNIEAVCHREGESNRAK
jgi:catechol 2,3-dioxygenase-like lactoylglutathione lyase family enzyme